MPAMPYAFGVIPARGGSTGLPGKNLRKLGGLSLIGQAIASARESALLARFIVSTDSEEIAAEAERHGAPVPFLRPGELATDEAGMLGVLRHAVRWLESSGGVKPDGDRTEALFPDGHTYVRRQDAPPVYQPSGAVYVTRYDTLMRHGHILGEDNRGIVMGFEASVNIDTEWDFLLAELLLREGRASLPPGRS